METGDGAGDDWVSAEGPFDGAGIRLYFRSVRPAGRSAARLAIVHGYGDHGGRYTHFMRWMAHRGVACHATDLRGQGSAGGRRGFVRRWDDYLEDLRAFFNLPATREPADGPLFVLGHSHGGLVVAAAGIEGILRDAGVAGCAMSAPFFRSALPKPGRNRLLARILNPVVPWLAVRTGLSADMMSSDPQMVRESLADPLCPRVATPRWYLGHLGAQERVMNRAAEFTLPLLVLIAGADRVADPAAAREFFDRAGSADKSQHLYPRMLHELLRESGREVVFNDLLAWIRSRQEAWTARSATVVAS